MRKLLIFLASALTAIMAIHDKPTPTPIPQPQPKAGLSFRVETEDGGTMRILVEEKR